MAYRTTVIELVTGALSVQISCLMTFENSLEGEKQATDLFSKVVKRINKGEIDEQILKDGRVEKGQRTVFLLAPIEPILHFSCPKCGCCKLEQVVTNATIISKVKTVRFNHKVEYQDKPEFKDAEYGPYRCVSCKHELVRSINGVQEKVSEEGELVDYLTENALA